MNSSSSWLHSRGVVRSAYLLVLAALLVSEVVLFSLFQAAVAQWFPGVFWIGISVSTVLAWFVCAFDLIPLVGVLTDMRNLGLRHATGGWVLLSAAFCAVVLYGLLPRISENSASSDFFVFLIAFVGAFFLWAVRVMIFVTLFLLQSRAPVKSS